MRSLLPISAALGLIAVACLDDSRTLLDGSRAGGAPDAGVVWQQVFSGLPGALISVWGSSSRDVWAVGSDTHDGRGPLVLRYDGSRWTRPRAETSGDLWWVHGFAGGPVFLGGSSGRILRYDGARFSPVAAPSTPGVVYGVWGSDPSSVWAVGGAGSSPAAAFVWRLRGDHFEPASGIPVSPGEVTAYFKVWGSSATDVWVVGSPGIVLHYDGVRFERPSIGVSDPLFTVHATAAGHAAIVGGADLGVLAEGDRGTWSLASLPSGTRALFGVWLTPGGGYAVGDRRTVLARSSGGWRDERTGLDGEEALHAAWVDETGSVWAVGGHVLVPPLGAGVLLHKGPRIATTFALDSGDAGANPEAGDGALPPSDARAGADARDASDARVVATDAADGRPLCAPGAADAASVGSVECGASACPLPAEKCCVNESSGAAVGCVSAATACPTGQAPVSCDGPEDCATGSSCCLNRFLQAGSLANVQCEASACGGPSVCGSCADCASAACSTFALMPSFLTCSP